MFIKQKSYIALLDTGADISCISADLAQNLITQKVVKMQPSSLAMIRGVGGQTTRVLGSLDVPLKIAGLTIPQPFIVVDTLTHSRRRLFTVTPGIPQLCNTRLVVI